MPDIDISMSLTSNIFLFRFNSVIRKDQLIFSIFIFLSFQHNQRKHVITFLFIPYQTIKVSDDNVRRSAEQLTIHSVAGCNKLFQTRCNSYEKRWYLGLLRGSAKAMIWCSTSGGFCLI